METKLNYKRTFLIGLAFLSICSFWQMYDNIIPLILQNTYHLGETMTGAVMALDNVLAIFLLPVFGALSDKVHTKLGRRMPFIVAGTILAVIFMMLLPMIDNAEKARWNTGESFSNQVIFLAVLFFTLVSMGLYRSPAVALMPDVTPNHLRSRANAVINLMGAVGGVYALIMIKVLVGKGETPDYLPLFASIAAVMAIAASIFADKASICSSQTRTRSSDILFGFLSRIADGVATCDITTIISICIFPSKPCHSCPAGSSARTIPISAFTSSNVPFASIRISSLSTRSPP